MVGQQYGTLKWSIGYKTTGTGPYSDRCIELRVGGCKSRDQNRWLVAQDKTRSTGTISHKVFHFDVCQNVENVRHPYPGRQNDSLELLLKMVEKNNPDVMQISKEIWEFLLGQGITITAEHSPGIPSKIT